MTAGFDHGVASGDPTPAGVVLWTRVSGASGDLDVGWEVATDDAFADVAASGTARALGSTDHTVQVDVAGLAPATSYRYRFTAEGATSPTGRTRTARATDDPGEVRIGVVSCSSYAGGAFDAFRLLATEDVDLVVHLGDVVYERGSGAREHEPAGTAVTLADYRARHAQHHRDPDLQALLAAHPIVATWDDHDVAGNAWLGGAEAHDPDEHGPWAERRTAALRAWLEWLPVRRPDPAAPERIWRRLPLGAAAELVVLDTRHDGRDEQVSSADEAGVLALRSPDRALVSEGQRAFVADAVRSSPAAWRVLANQVVLTPLAFEVPDVLGSATEALGLTVDGKVLNPDAWDGYPAERERLLAFLAEAGPSVVLTGDVHSSWAFEVTDEADRPVTVEWVTPSVSAQVFADIVGLPSPRLAPAAVDLIGDQLPSVRWAELTRHGFVVASFTPERAQADWWHVDDDGGAAVAASWAVEPVAPVLLAADPLGPRAAPSPATTPSPTSAPTPTPTVPVGDGGLPTGPIAGGLAAVAATLGGLIAFRRRRRSH